MPLSIRHQLLTARRAFLRTLGAMGIVPLVHCNVRDEHGTELEGDPGPGTNEGCSPIPEEGAGPFAGDGSDNINVLALPGIVRRDIRTSLGGSTGVAEGVPLTLTLTLVDSTAGCAPLADYAIYIWHCDREGYYSLYSEAVRAENYLRGVQPTAADGTATFTTIFPGCYPDRMPHIHLETYPSLERAVDATALIHTSQIAFDVETCEAVYASAGYGDSANKFKSLRFESDGVFRDGVSLQLTRVTGSVDAGYSATITVGIES